MEYDSKHLHKNFSHYLLAFLMLLAITTVIFIQSSLIKLDFLEKTYIAMPVIIEKPILTKVLIDIDSFVAPKGRPLVTDNNLSVSSGYGLRVHPISKQLKFHTGVDMGCPVGSPVISTACGKVVRIQYQFTGYGNNIVIEHNGTYRTLYAHLDEISVKVNQLVEKGQVIGYSGNTGTSTSPHLHYEVVMNNQKVDPQPYL